MNECKQMDRSRRCLLGTRNGRAIKEVLVNLAAADHWSRSSERGCQSRACNANIDWHAHFRSCSLASGRVLSQQTEARTHQGSVYFGQIEMDHWGRQKSGSSKVKEKKVRLEPSLREVNPICPIPRRPIVCSLPCNPIKSIPRPLFNYSPTPQWAAARK